MTYNPNIPISSDIPAQSQAQFLTNFQQLNTVFDADHVPFNDATSANRGKHDKSTYIAGSDPATAAGEIAVYSKNAGGVPELFMRDQSSGTVIQLSKGVPSATFPGSTFLPGGVSMKWGNLTFSGTSGSAVYSSAFTASPFSVVLTPVNPAAQASSWRVDTTSLSGFTMATNPSVTNAVFFYIALGV